MLKTYRVFAYAIALAVVIQGAAIAFGLFEIGAKLDDGAVITSDESTQSGLVGLDLHGILGTMVIPVIVIAFVIFSLFVRVKGAKKWSLVIFGLVALQIALAFTAFGIPAVGILHGANAFVIVWAALAATRVGRTAK